MIAHNVMKHQPHTITAKNGQLANQPTRIKEKERGEKREEIEDERETGQEKSEPPRKRQMKMTDFQENESIIDRSCFEENLPMTPDFYRRIWITDIMNRTEIVQGFQELMVSGIYERSFFGDIMMASIAF